MNPFPMLAMKRLILLVAIVASFPAQAEEQKLAIDLTGLSEGEKATFIKITEEQFCPCGNPQSFLTTLKDPKTCGEALPLGRYLLDKVKEGGSRRSIAKAFLKRVANVNSRIQLTITDSTPRIGKADAPIQLVIFSDFECPYCSRVHEPVRKLVSKHKDVTLFYKYFPLQMHTHARNAAKAAYAAHQQGKFWEMHDAIFESQGDLSDEAYGKMAKQLKLNGKTFEKDRLSTQAEAAVAADIKEGDAARLSGTPSLYVNGLLVDNPDDLEKAFQDARDYEN